MAPIRYSLHYEDYSEHLMSRFGKLLQTQCLVDMTLMCNSHTLRVHKAVLAASSAYFQEVLEKQVGEPLVILKMRFSVMKCLVEFMYCGKTQCLEENLDELVSAAQFLKIKGLSKVTKEGLGITDSKELPVFTPPVVINRPPLSLVDQQQENDPKNLLPPPLTPLPSSSMDSFNRPNKDAVVRIPFDIDKCSGGALDADYVDLARTMKPRRGRPTANRRGWGAGPLSRAAERALLRREQDSRKAIHHLKHLQTRQMQEYMERVTLSQAVSSICSADTPSSYVDSDLMYLDQSPDVLGPAEPLDSMPEDTPSSYQNTSKTSVNDNGDGMGTAMSQYVNALKNAGLPTDLPILFESGDGSYVNVNEQVLLDMVQSSEIQYEVIEQPNIIEKVADPSEIKSIDELSKSIERGEILSSKSYSSNDYNKDADRFDHPEDAMTGLNTMLTDNLESFDQQQNYGAMDRLQGNVDSMTNENSDFASIDRDMQYFTKTMSDDVKKYYEEQQLSDTRAMEQLCPTSSSLDTNFTISLLDEKNSHINASVNEQFAALNTEAMRRSEDCYDFTLPLPQSNVFKDDIDCLITTPRRNDDDDGNAFAQAKDEIIKDLMSLENNMSISQKVGNSNTDGDMLAPRSDVEQSMNDSADLTSSIHTSDLRWDGYDVDDEPCKDTGDDRGNKSKNQCQDKEEKYQDTNEWNIVNESENKENKQPESDATSLESVPYAVGLLPMNQVQQIDESNLLKRKNSDFLDDLDHLDAKCLKRKPKSII